MIEVRGHAALWDRVAPLPVPEVVRRGAFRRSLASGRVVLALLFHDRLRPLAHTLDGSLALAEDDRGLAYRFPLPDTPTGRDALHALRGGHLTGASFTFTVPPGGERMASGLRELLDVDLLEITLTDAPIYRGTSVELLEPDHVS